MYITSQFAGKGYKDSDFALMQWHKHIIGLKPTLLVEIQAFLSSRWLPLLNRSLFFFL